MGGSSLAGDLVGSLTGGLAHDNRPKVDVGQQTELLRSEEARLRHGSLKVTTQLSDMGASTRFGPGVQPAQAAPIDLLRSRHIPPSKMQVRHAGLQDALVELADPAVLITPRGFQFLV